MNRDDLRDLLTTYDPWACVLIDPEDLKRLDADAYAAYQEETKYRENE